MEHLLLQEGVLQPTDIMIGFEYDEATCLAAEHACPKMTMLPWDFADFHRALKVSGLGHLRTLGFDICDLDFCGPFSRAALKGFGELCNDCLSWRSGIAHICINHKKGHEQSGSTLRLINTVDELAEEADRLWFDDAQKTNGDSYNYFRQQTKQLGRALERYQRQADICPEKRLIGIPVLYALQAAVHGYNTRLHKVIEYSDNHVFMLQYFFKLKYAHRIDYTVSNISYRGLIVDLGHIRQGYRYVWENSVSRRNARCSHYQKYEYRPKQIDG